MNNIKCIVFKPSGKYYTDEDVPIAESAVSNFDIPNEVRRNRMLLNMYYVGTTNNNVPFLILPKER